MYRNCRWAALSMKTVAAIETDVQVDTILARVADHMTHLAETLASTETAVAKHFEDVLAQDDNAFQDVQNLDYLHQSMTDTAALLNTLGRGCRHQAALIQHLKLEATRALVRGEPAENNSTQAGDIDLF